MRPAPRGAAVLLPVAVAALLAAAWGGLARMGWALPAGRLAGLHGPLIVSGFLGTVIGLERAVALGRRWAHAAPFGTALGAALVLAGAPRLPAAALLLLGSAVLCCVYLAAYRRQPAPFPAVMGLGALCLAAAHGLVAAGRPVFLAVPWWMGFLVLTIVGERLELSRLRPPSRHRQAVFLFLVTLYLGALILSLTAYGAAGRLAGVSFLGLAAWLWRHDVARVTIRQRGLARFIAAGLLSGYAWLAVGGFLFVLFGGVTAGPRYDAELHAVFLGFVFSMIFAHAPIVLPALTGTALPFRTAFYAHLALLHASLLVRLGGDLTGQLPLRAWGGLLNVAAILAFLLGTAWAASAGLRADRREPAPEAEHPLTPPATASRRETGP